LNKKEALSIIIRGAEEYHKNLENKNLLIIYEKDDVVDFIETNFYPRNFLHLTGIEIINKKIHSSVEFYNLCLKKRISINDFSFKKDGTSILKLQSLIQVFQIYKNAKIIGQYNNQRPYLRTNILVGNINYCMGFIKNKNYEIPNTILKEDIRKITNEQFRVVRIYRKGVKEKQYIEQTYSNKKIDIDKNTLENVTSHKIYIKE